MSLNVRVTPTTSSSAIALAIRRRAQPALRRRVDAIGDEGIREVVAEVNATFNTGRPEARRRPGQKLNDPSAYEFKADNVGLDVSGQWRIVGDEGFKVKFFGLHNGIRSHRIAKKGTGRLAYNRQDGASTDYNFFPKAVTWTPGAKSGGIPFYQRALQRVMARSRR